MILDGLVDLWVSGGANAAGLTVVAWATWVCWRCVRDEYAERGRRGDADARSES
jgi:hypothetical protein